MDINHAYDEYYMQICLSLATRGWGNTLTNPLVGALIVKQNRIIGQGYHRKLGEAHAEILALLDAGTRAWGATLYVNLEPCCCSGRTPPCVPSIIQAGIKRVVVGTIDLNPAVNGKGIEQLRAHGIEVEVGILSTQAHDLNRAYWKWIVTKKPYTIMKIAISGNAKISGYADQYITSLPSLRIVHALRSRVSAVLIGINTVLCDDPQLTDRHVGRHDPARIILDKNLDIPLQARVLAPGVNRILFTRARNSDRVHVLQDKGVTVVFYDDDVCPVSRLLSILGTMDIGSLLIEGGGMVFDEFFNAEAYDEIYLFQAPESVATGKSLTDRVLNYIVSHDTQPVMIGKDRLYHVYRNH